MLDRLFTLDSSVDNPENLEYGSYNNFFSDVLITPLIEFRDYMSKSAYIGPLREIPGRNFVPEKSPDISRWSSGLRAWDYLSNDVDMVERVNAWFSEPSKLNAGYEVKLHQFRELPEESALLLKNRGSDIDVTRWVAEVYESLPQKSRILFIDLLSRTELQPQDLGVGISQVIPVIVSALLKEAELPLTCIEQPELHIHPAFQVVLGDLFASAISLDDSETREMISAFSEANIEFCKVLKDAIDRGNLGASPGDLEGNFSDPEFESSSDPIDMAAYASERKMATTGRDSTEAVVLLDAFSAALKSRNSNKLNSKKDNFNPTFEPYEVSLIRAAGAIHTDMNYFDVRKVFANKFYKDEYTVLSDPAGLYRQFASRKQFIIETHSEHLMLRLLKRIRQTTDGEIEPGSLALYSDEVSVIYVEPGEDSVSIKNIGISDDGEFKNSWPKGFFGERRQELM
jgi:hypothetical protein